MSALIWCVLFQIAAKINPASVATVGQKRPHESAEMDAGKLRSQALSTIWSLYQAVPFFFLADDSDMTISGLVCQVYRLLQ